MLSRFAFDGWQGHYRRMQRWHDRLVRASMGGRDRSMDEQVDMALVFFQAAYHLRDYLQVEGAASKTQLDELIRNSHALRISRDIANGAKHRTIQRPSVDAEPWIFRALRPRNDWVLVVKADELVELMPLASQCVQAWDDFLAVHQLDPSSASAGATTMFAGSVPAVVSGTSE